METNSVLLASSTFAKVANLKRGLEFTIKKIFLVVKAITQILALTSYQAKFNVPQMKYVIFNVKFTLVQYTSQQKKLCFLDPLQRV